MTRFADRTEAGRLLGQRLAELAPLDPLVLALPRGGVPVGVEVARVLGCDLDIVLVRKLGLPGQPELAMGAVAEGDVVIRNEDLIRLAGVTEAAFQAELEAERATLARRSEIYRGDRPQVDPANRTVLLVDDGLATGATAMAAVEAIRRRNAREVWVCVPVAPPDTVETMSVLADRVVVLHQPSHFVAVGAWYQRFHQVPDDEVRALLDSSPLP